MRRADNPWEPRKSRAPCPGKEGALTLKPCAGSATIRLAVHARAYGCRSRGLWIEEAVAWIRPRTGPKRPNGCA